MSSTPYTVPSNRSSRSHLGSSTSKRCNESEIVNIRDDGKMSNLATEGASDVIEIVLKPHPTEADNRLVKALKGKSVRFLKTPINALGSY